MGYKKRTASSWIAWFIWALLFGVFVAYLAVEDVQQREAGKAQLQRLSFETLSTPSRQSLVRLGFIYGTAMVLSGILVAFINSLGNTGKPSPKVRDNWDFSLEPTEQSNPDPPPSTSSPAKTTNLSISDYLPSPPNVAQAPSSPSPEKSVKPNLPPETIGFSNAMLEFSELLSQAKPLRDITLALQSILARFFPGGSGALYLHNPNHELLQMLVTFGDTSVGPPSLHPSECSCLSIGSTQSAIHGEGNSACGPCAHFRAFTSGFSICAPVRGMEEYVGILALHMNGNPPAQGFGPRLEAWKQTALVMTGMLGLYAANLTLQDRFQIHSIRDKVTGMFNRRYLDESLRREVSAAQRKKIPIGIILMHPDRIAEIRENLGTSAANQILYELGERIPQYIRTEDIPCRFDGDILCVLLPGAGLEITQQRAEKIRHEVQGLEIGFRGKILATTLSLGVAVLPQHGVTGQALVVQAERALYQARSNGKNLVSLPA